MPDPANYVDEVVDQLAATLPDCPDYTLLRLYALLAFVKGQNTTLEDVHDAWALWRTTTRPDHPSIIPFDQLTPEVQHLDAKYALAIRAAAADLRAKAEG